MAKALPTVEVVNPNAPGETIIINKSDYDADPDRYEVAEGGDAAEVSPLKGVNVSDLPAALAEVEDVDVIRAAAEADSRSTAAEHYEARLAELEGGAEAAEEEASEEEGEDEEGGE